MANECEQISFDVLFVGAGPANLAGAIRLMQAAKEKGTELEVALIEKGAELGSHGISGAVLNPIALNELMPDYIQKGCPIETTIQGDGFYFLTHKRSISIPFIPRYLHNKGYHVISLAKFNQWLGAIAEDMGVNIFPGFTGKKLLLDEKNQRVLGVRTGEKGLDLNGNPKNAFEPAIDLLAKVTVFGEGARGSLVKELDSVMGISKDSMPQAYETGIKEVIALPENSGFEAFKGCSLHLLGYPLGLGTPGGGFVYEMKDNRVALGYLVGLSYEDPLCDIYDLFVQFKQQPFVRSLIQGGKVIEQGARTVSTGGYFSMPKLVVDGGMLVGGCAGIHNVPALKGIHVSMKSGMLAAEAILDALADGDTTGDGLARYPDAIEKSWLKNELYEGRNFYQALSKKGISKFFHLGAQYVTGGRGFRDRMPLEDDSQTLKTIKNSGLDADRSSKPAAYDGVLMVDKLTGVYLSKTMHREDQPPHLIIHDMDLCVNACFPKYQHPCTRFCPGDVYELVADEDKAGGQHIKLNPSNCFHCKTCDVKDPFNNITWTCPEGGDGPGYTVV
jgi:electron-transferring-flavoprotein dehydrogenase